MATLQALVLTCCLLSGTPSIPVEVAEPLEIESFYETFPEELRPYLTEEQEVYLQENYVETEEASQELDEITSSCNTQKVLEEERIALEQRQAAEEARLQEIDSNVSSVISSTSSPGVGYCAKWVSMVYQNAGYGYIGGNADDMYYNYCDSSDRNELRNGMLVAVPSWNGSARSYEYGHIGIYIDGMVWHNIGPIQQTPLDEWIATYGQIEEVRWGFPI